MSIGRYLRPVVALAFTVSISGAALARQPAPLVAQQAAASTSNVEPGSGYRDLNARFGAVADRAPQVMTATGGYRDIAVRFAHGRVGSSRTTATMPGAAVR